jgi:hypothetical protein
MDDSTIFARTGLGTQMARDASAELPRALRTLLLTIDGRTPLRSYRTMLTHLGDVPSLVQALEESGYIARTGSQTARQISGTMPNTQIGFRNSQADLRNTLSAGSPLDSPRTMSGPPSQFGQFGQLARGANTVGNRATQPDLVSRIEQLQSQMPMAAPTIRPAAINTRMGPGSGSASVIQNANLNKAKELMTDFLMKNMPEVAIEVSISIDRLNTLSEMQGNLTDYSQLIAPLGRAGSEHLKELRALINI